MNGKYVATSWYCIINRTKLRLLFPASVSVKPNGADVGATMCSTSVHPSNHVSTVFQTISVFECRSHMRVNYFV